MAHYNFRKDLKEGVKGEEFIITYLESKGLSYLHSNNDNKYDIKMIKENKESTYEIKTDVWCTPTQDRGNLFLEFECRGKASGIEVTEADWFVTFFPHLREIWFIKTDKLKSLIQTENFRMTSQSGDAGSNTRGYLINRKNYKEQFNVYTL
jgi:hypothetical protein